MERSEGVGPPCRVRFFFSSRRRHTRLVSDWSSDVCSSDLPKLSRARAAGAPVHLGRTSGMADGLLAVQIGTVPFAHHALYVDEVVTVEDAALPEAMRFLLDRMKLVAEPSGAITVAALLTGAASA